MKRIFLYFLVTLLSAFPVDAMGALIDRGGGLIYHTEFDVTWLQDANYAKTSGYDADGLMTWDGANTWVSNLEYEDTVRNTIWDDWRLPTALNKDGSFPPTFGTIGVDNELGHLFYVELGNTYYPDTTPYYTGLFNRLRLYDYWSSTRAPGSYGPNYQDYFFDFELHYSYLSPYHRDGEGYAFAVRTGDVGPIPIPSALWLLGSGLIGLAGFRRRFKKGYNM